MKGVLRILFWMTALVLASIALLVWMWNGHGFDWQQFQKVRRGMSREEVASLMGKPSKTNSDGVTESWIYEKHFNLCGGVISFDFTGKVQSTFHDH